MSDYFIDYTDCGTHIFLYSGPKHCLGGANCYNKVVFIHLEKSHEIEKTPISR